MAILAGITVPSGINYIENYISQKELSRMVMIQSKVKNVGEQYRFDYSVTLHGKIYSELSDDTKKTINEAIESSIEEEELSKYHYIVSEDLTNLKLDTINRSSHNGYLVNYSTSNVISLKGIKHNDNTYYRLSDIINSTDLLKYGSIEIAGTEIQEQQQVYAIVFNANGGTGRMPKLTEIVSTDIKQLPLNTFTKAGYTFMGWSTNSEGNVEYKDGEEVSGLATSGTVTLYAIWEDKILPTFLGDPNVEKVYPTGRYVYIGAYCLRNNVTTYLRWNEIDIFDAEGEQIKYTYPTKYYRQGNNKLVERNINQPSKISDDDTEYGSCYWDASDVNYLPKRGIAVFDLNSSMDVSEVRLYPYAGVSDVCYYDVRLSDLQITMTSYASVYDALNAVGDDNGEKGIKISSSFEKSNAKSGHSFDPSASNLFTTVSARVTNISVTFEDAGSGVTLIEYSPNGTTWNNIGEEIDLGVSSLTAQKNGLTGSGIAYFRAKDALGNYSEIIDVPY